MPLSWWTSGTPTASDSTVATSTWSTVTASTNTVSLGDYSGATTTGGTVYWWTDATTTDDDGLVLQRAFVRQIAREQEQQALIMQQSLAQCGQGLQQADQQRRQRALSYLGEIVRQQGDLQAPNLLTGRAPEAIVAEAAERAAARDRAEHLLLDRLTKQQRATYRRNGFFVVKGGKTGHSYRIRADGSLVANVDRLDSAGAIIHRLCAHAQHHLMPLGDHLYAQMLNIEHDEEEFLRVANVHR